MKSNKYIVKSNKQQVTRKKLRLTNESYIVISITYSFVFTDKWNSFVLVALKGSKFYLGRCQTYMIARFYF